jgi:RNA polymerase sigma-70 factor (ECF subfamily)
MMPTMRLPLMTFDATLAASRDLDNTVPVMDEEEFRAFYERTARPLWSYLSRMTGDRHTADDVLQEAYYRFYRAGARHEDETHRRNSLFRIATNLVRDGARRAKHRNAVSLEALSDEGQPSAAALHAAPSTPERQTEVRMDLSRALGRLEPLQRELLWLAYAQGASHEEIAGILGLRAISIRTLLLRARRKMAGLLGGGASKEAGKETRKEARS